jgi:hypothetical protein
MRPPRRSSLRRHSASLRAALCGTTSSISISALPDAANRP